MTAWLTPSEYAKYSEDPVGMLNAANKMISKMNATLRCLKSSSKQLVELKAATDNAEMTEDQFAKLHEHYDELKKDHTILSSKFGEMQRSHESMHNVIQVLRGDKEALVSELESAKRQAKIVASNRKRVTSYDWRVEKDQQEARLRANEAEINQKIAQCNEYSQTIVELLEETNVLSKEIDVLENERIPLETQTATLLQTLNMAKQSKAFLKQELAATEEELHRKNQALLQVKKEMSASVLELQLKIVKTEEELEGARLNTQREADVLDKQNLWLTQELTEKTKQLLEARAARTGEAAKYKTEIMLLREKANRLRSNLEVISKKNGLLAIDLRRLDALGTLSKNEYVRRKEEMASRIEDQDAQEHRMELELQTAREDLLLLRSRLCRRCRSEILNEGSLVPTEHLRQRLTTVSSSSASTLVFEPGSPKYYEPPRVQQQQPQSPRTPAAAVPPPAPYTNTSTDRSSRSPYLQAPRSGGHTGSDNDSGLYPATAPVTASERSSSSYSQDALVAAVLGLTVTGSEGELNLVQQAEILRRLAERKRASQQRPPPDSPSDSTQAFPQRPVAVKKASPSSSRSTTNSKQQHKKKGVGNPISPRG